MYLLLVLRVHSLSSLTFIVASVYKVDKVSNSTSFDPDLSFTIWFTYMNGREGSEGGGERGKPLSRATLAGHSLKCRLCDSVRVSYMTRTGNALRMVERYVHGERIHNLSTELIQHV